MAILNYRGVAHYVSFSETANKGRNSFFQSVPSALNSCIIDGGKAARPYYYFLPVDGNYQTSYHKFMYRLLDTAGVVFLNAKERLDDPLRPFSTVEDLRRARDANRLSNRSNNSTFITVDGARAVQIYAKVYGASKYESELLALSLRNITKREKTPIEIFEIQEQDLKCLPQSSKDALLAVGEGRISIFESDLTLDRNQFVSDKGDSLRSPRYVYNLHARIGDKRCALCDCNVPEIIQGAHIWGVSQIRKFPGLTQECKFEHAISGDNGLWLCENHHKLFDADLIRIASNGKVDIRNGMSADQVAFIRHITPGLCVRSGMMSEQMKYYIARRYAA